MTLNRLLDRLAPARQLPEIAIGRHRMSSWRFCGLAGLVGGSAVVLDLAAARSLDVVPVAALLLVETLAFGAWMRRLARAERGAAILYRMALPALGATAALASLLGAPPLRLLDAWIVGLCVFLCCGRLGCLLSGCCHGHASCVGLRYPWLLGRAAPAGWQELRMAPVAGIEAALLGTLAALGSAMLRQASARDGEVLVLVLSSYGAGRFALELLRGDAARAFWHRWSEAQWVSALVILAAGVWAAVQSEPAAPAMGPPVVAAFAVAVTAAIGRRHTGRPPFCPQSLRDLADLRRIAVELDRRGGGALQTAHGLEVELRRGAADEYGLRGVHRPLDRGSQAAAAMLLAEHRAGLRAASDTARSLRR